MSGNERTVSVGGGLKVTLTAWLGASPRINCHWQPYLPRKLSDRQRRRYEAARDAMLIEMASAFAAQTEKGKSDV